MGILSFPMVLVLLSSLIGSFLPFAGSPAAAPPAVDVGSTRERELLSSWLQTPTFILLSILTPLIRR